MLSPQCQSQFETKQVRITTTPNPTGLEEATRPRAPAYAHRGTALPKHPPTNNDQQTLWHEPTNKFAGVHDSPQKCSHKHNPTILLLNAYTLAHYTDQAIHAPTHIQIKAYNLSYTYRARHRSSHPHIQVKPYKLHTHTEQSIQTPHTY